MAASAVSNVRNARLPAVSTRRPRCGCRRPLAKAGEILNGADDVRERERRVTQETTRQLLLQLVLQADISAMLRVLKSCMERHLTGPCRH